MPVPPIPQSPPIPLPSIPFVGGPTFNPSGLLSGAYPRAWDLAWQGIDDRAFALVSDYLKRLRTSPGWSGYGEPAGESGAILTPAQFFATRSSIGSLVPDLAARGLGGASPEFLSGMVSENLGQGVGPQLKPNILELVRRYLSEGSQGWPTL